MTKMKFSLLAAVILVFLQSIAVADSGGSFDNSGGTLTAVEVGHSTNYTLSAHSDLSSVSGVSGLACGGSTGIACSGTFNYTTTAMPLSKLNNVGGPITDLGAGGTVTIKENGATVFSGSFVSIGGNPAATWTWTGSASSNDYQWTLMGTVSGTYTVPGHAPMTVNGAIIQLTVQASSDPFTATGSHKIGISGGNANLPGVVPEPDTLVLFGTGLIGIVLVAKRKYLSGFKV
jgi:hypothetical protein